MTCSGCDRSKEAAIKTLERLGYTYHSGEEWKPPLGENPFKKWKRHPFINDQYVCPVCYEIVNTGKICWYQVCPRCKERLEP